MNAAAAMFEERAEPGEWLSLALAVLVHVLLALVLIFGVRWQNRPPESVTVELWEAPQAAPPPPVVEPKPAPKVESPPPPPAPKPEPRIEKPDIAEKAPPPKPKPEAKKIEPKPKPIVKPEPLKPRVTEAEKQMKEQAAREHASFALERERQVIAEQLKREAAQASAAANARALASYRDKIRLKIRGNLVLPTDIKGNPEAIFDVVQLVTGEVYSVKLRKSSGHPGFDNAVERAILKSSPLPKPDRPELFQKELELKYRPLDPV